MIKIGRAIEGVSINGKEWLLDNSNNIMWFKNREEAINFLKLNDYEKLSNEELQDSFFFEKEEEY